MNDNSDFIVFTASFRIIQPSHGRIRSLFFWIGSTYDGSWTSALFMLWFKAALVRWDLIGSGGVVMLCSVCLRGRSSSYMGWI